MNQTTEDQKREKNRIACAKWRAANLEKAREAVRKWNKENPEVIRGAVRRFRDKHPEKIAEWAKAYRQKHPEKVKVWTNKWRTENPERYKEARKAYQRRSYAKDPSKSLAQSAAWAKANVEANRAKARKHWHKKQAEKKAAQLLTP